MKFTSDLVEVPLHYLSSIPEMKRYLQNAIPRFEHNLMPVRFAVTSLQSSSFICEIDSVEVEHESEMHYFNASRSLFDLRMRDFEDTGKFTAVLLIPTGIGAEIGGHCGDGNVVARLLASGCDTLITHPNVVNASDLNEMTENTLYVEGGTLTEFVCGMIGLRPVRSNRILMVMDKSEDDLFNNEVVNAVSSARVTLGIDCEVLELSDSIDCVLKYSASGRAIGEISGFEKLLNSVSAHRSRFDALGLATVLQLPNHSSREYFFSNADSVNPWGGAEAMITHAMSSMLQVPAAHSPLSSSRDDLHLNFDLGIVDPRKAPETASVSYLHCILKGLHRSPKIVSYDAGMNNSCISCLVIPDGCIGLPVLACLAMDIPVIAVRNSSKMNADLSSLPFKHGKLLYADNYVEAAGLLTMLKAGISRDTLIRPIKPTVYRKQ